MSKQERFSLRKHKLGAVPVLLGAFFLVSAGYEVRADELSPNNPALTQVETSSQWSEETPDQTNQENPESYSTSTASEPITSLALDQVSPEISNPTTEAPDHLDPETSGSDATAETEAPLADQEKPKNIDSNTIITVPETWDTGYKGEGMIVAVIDSGLDIEHDALRLSDINKAKYQSEDQLKQAMAEAGITYGRWYSDKVVYGYNYVDVNTELKEAETSSHGMHVTGIAAGNPSQPVGGELIYGVAPEAQVMFMRVFSDVHSTTGQALYVRAIEDAVKLKADAINLSLGGANGSTVNVGDQLIAAIEMARKAGVSVVIAAGNDGTFGSGHSNPHASNPDYGLVGSPSTARDAISVASYNNSTIMSEVVQIIGLEDNVELNHGKSSFTNADASEIKFDKDKAYELVYAGLGLEDDFANIDITGKLALIKRGEITFNEKIANAAAHGATGVVIFNHTPGATNISMALDESGSVIPSIFIPYEFGTAIQENPSLKLSFKDQMDKSANPQAGKPSDFSSWGLSADGELKPDLSAPGGSIFAAINDNKYEMKDGTSMAAPHVAGAAVLVKQYLKEAYPDKTDAEYEALIKNLMMSTANPHFNEETQAYTSPRQQGAGVLDTKAAISTGLYVTGSDQYGSVNLGNVNDAFSFVVVVHNITDQDKTLDYITHVNTDLVEADKITLKPRELKTVSGQPITVKANSSTTVLITVDTSEFSEELTELMPNGYYLDGFVRFVDPTDKGDVISIPYVGFKGEFQNLEVLEKPVLELLMAGKTGVYFGEAAPGKENVTGLITNSSDLSYANNNTPTDFAIKSLGTFADGQGGFVLEFDGTGAPRFAISPNGDSNQDSLALRGVFLRNFTNLVASVYKADDTEQTTPLWQSKPEFGDKNYFSGDPKNEKSTVLYKTEFAGRDNDGKELEDGHYKYVLTYYPEVPGAKMQRMSFDIIIDRQAPKVTTATYDEATFVFKPRPAVEYGPSTIVRERVFYLVRDEDGDATIIKKDGDTGKLSIVDNRVYLTQNSDGSFDLPLDLAVLADFYYVVEDFAGNIVSAKVKDLVSIGNNFGLVDVNVVDSETGAPTNVTHSFSVKDADGNIVTDLPRYAETKNVIKLPFGTYTFDLFIHDAERSAIDGKTSVTLDLTEENSRQSVDFLLKLLAKQMVTTVFNQQLPEGTRVDLTTAAGQILNLPVARYNPLAYSKFTPVGDYSLSLNLPEGYEILEDLAISVAADAPSIKQLTLIDKTALLAASRQTVTDHFTYYNASPEAKTAYDLALNSAQTVLENKNDQLTVDQATEALLDAIANLNGTETDTTRLEQLITASQSLIDTEDASYRYAATSLKTEFDLTLAQALNTLTQDHLTQEAVDAVTNLLAAAKEALNGVAPTIGLTNPDDNDQTASVSIFDPALDDDGDGFSNAIELIAGTDPTDKDSFPQTAKGNLKNNGVAEEAEPLPVFDPARDDNGELSLFESTSDSQERLMPKPLTAQPSEAQVVLLASGPSTISPITQANSNTSTKSLPKTGEMTNWLTIFGLISLATVVLNRHCKKIKD